MRARRVFLLLLAMLLPRLGWGQSAEAASQRLVGQPLYLRGFWMGQTLEFDGAGHLAGEATRNDAAPGPLTLSGVTITAVAMRGNELVLRGNRVALVADEEGRLQRRDVKSTTGMPLTFQKEYRAKQEVKIVVHPDAAGRFDTALQAIFANGLGELAADVPPYWRCYAAGYFAAGVNAGDAARVVQQCVAGTGVPETATGDASPPKLLQQVHIDVPWQTGELAHDKAGIDAECRIHFVVGPRGVPLRFQVVRAVGAGLDEEVLQAVSDARFTPATRNGAAVAANDEFAITFRSEKR